MSTALGRSRDRAIATMRWVATGVILFGFTATGGIAGLLSRQHAEASSTSTAEGTQDAQAGPENTPRAAGQRDVRLPLSTSSHRVLVVVHGPSRAGTQDVAPAADGSSAAAPAPAPAPVPTVTPPPEQVEPVGSSSGSDPG
jgi:hypothetical protein